MTTKTKTIRANQWTHKGWRIERCLDHSFMVASPGSNLRSVKAKTLAECKALINNRIAQAEKDLALLKAAGVNTIGDLDKIREVRNSSRESRFDALARLVGNQLAHELLHTLQTKEKV